MPFPNELTNAIDGSSGTDIIAAHINNLEAKVGIDNSVVTTSLDYMVRHTTGGHHHDGIDSRKISHSDLLNLNYASAGHTGFEPTVIKGNLTAGSNKITIGGTGTGALIGVGASVDVNQSNLDHGSIGGLSDDDHTQYALLSGRTGGQVLIGGTGSGDNLNLRSSSNLTKGRINFGALTTSYYDEANDQWIIGAPIMSDIQIGSNVYGHNLTINGTIGASIAPPLTPDYWQVTAGWDLSGGTLNKNANGMNTLSSLTSFGLQAGVLYKVILVVSSLSSGSFTWSLTDINGRTISSPGTYVDFILAQSTGGMSFFPLTISSRFEITSVSVSPLQANTGMLNVGNAIKLSGGLYCDNMTLCAFIDPSGYLIFSKDIVVPAGKGVAKLYSSGIRRILYSSALGGGSGSTLIKPSDNYDGNGVGLVTYGEAVKLFVDANTGNVGIWNYAPVSSLHATLLTESPAVFGGARIGTYTSVTFPTANKDRAIKTGLGTALGFGGTSLVGSLLIVTGGTGATVGLYRVIALIDANTVQVDRNIHNSGSDITNGSIGVARDVLAICATDGTNGQRIMNYSAQNKPLQIGGDILVATGHSLVGKDVLIGGVLECDGLIYADAGIDVASGQVYKLNNVQVVGARVIDARCDDAINESAWDATTAGVLDSLRDAMIAHGLIAPA